MAAGDVVTVRDAALKVVARWANPAIGITLAGSAALNGFAFMQGTDGPLATGAAGLMGCSYRACHTLTRSRHTSPTTESSPPDLGRPGARRREVAGPFHIGGSCRSAWLICLCRPNQAALS
jgi:hypothetical protein